MFSDSGDIIIPILHREREKSWEMWLVRTEMQIGFLHYKFRAFCKHLMENHIIFQILFSRAFPQIWGIVWNVHWMFFSFCVFHKCWCFEGSYFLHYSWFLVELLPFLHLCLTVGLLHFHVNGRLTLPNCTHKHIRIGMGGGKACQGKRIGREFGWFCRV